MAVISEIFNSKQEVFLDFVLSHYVAVGVDTLDQAKLTPLLKLKYRDSIADAVTDLGRPDEIGKAFSGFQRHLYTETNVMGWSAPLLQRPRAGTLSDEINHPQPR